jgi:hypothetical protein
MSFLGTYRHNLEIFARKPHRDSYYVYSFVEQLVCFAVYGYGIFAGIQLWRVRPKAVRQAKLFLFSIRLFALADYAFGAIWINIFTQESIRASALSRFLSGQTAIALIQTTFYVVIWYLYLVKSQRVRATFGQTLPTTSTSDLRVREDILYTDASGVENRGIRERSERDLRQVSEILKRLLRSDESVLYIARGAVMPGGFDLIVSVLAHIGYFLPFTNLPSALLVLTNYRLIALRTKRKLTDGWAWDRGILTAEWEEIVQGKGSLLLYIELVNQNGAKQRFWNLRRCDSQKVEALMSLLCPTGPKPIPPTALAFYSLCPRCFGTLNPGMYQCSTCSAVFKNEKSLIIRALLIPGGAYFYSGGYMLGAFSGLIETLILAVYVLDLIWIMRVGLHSRAPVYEELVYDAKIFPVLFLLKVVAIYRASNLIRGFIALSP